MPFPAHIQQILPISVVHQVARGRALPDYNRSVGKKKRHSNRHTDERSIANVLAEVITAVQSQKVPAKEALNAAMDSIGASQKVAMGLLLYATELQAAVVRELLADDRANPHSPVSQAGDLLLGAAARSCEAIGSLAAGMTSLLTAPAGPVKRPPKTRKAIRPSAPKPVAPKPQPLTESQLLEAIVHALADGYSSGLPGGAVADIIRQRYPAAIPVMQRYLSMDDFLVLMWMRQQPALAEIAASKEFPRFYAELKAGIGSQGAARANQTANR